MMLFNRKPRRTTRQPRYKAAPNPNRKTELCNQFGTAIGCRFGDKCDFAHGEGELRYRSVQTLKDQGRIKEKSKYRTQPCVKMVASGHCNYGSRCTFLHDRDLEGAAALDHSIVSKPHERTLNDDFGPPDRTFPWPSLSKAEDFENLAHFEAEMEKRSDDIDYLRPLKRGASEAPDNVLATRLLSMYWGFKEDLVGMHGTALAVSGNPILSRSPRPMPALETPFERLEAFKRLRVSETPRHESATAAHLSQVFPSPLDAPSPEPASHMEEETMTSQGPLATRSSGEGALSTGISRGSWDASEGSTEVVPSLRGVSPAESRLSPCTCLDFAMASPATPRQAGKPLFDGSPCSVLDLDREDFAQGLVPCPFETIKAGLGGHPFVKPPSRPLMPILRSPAWRVADHCS